jgi:hypothetical protein
VKGFSSFIIHHLIIILLFSSTQRGWFAPSIASFHLVWTNPFSNPETNGLDRALVKRQDHPKNHTNIG